MSKNKDKQNNNIIQLPNNIDSNDIETVIYIRDTINILHDEYLSTLNSDINTSKSMLLNHVTFTGLLLYIKTNLFSDSPIDIALSNYKHVSLSVDNIYILNFVFMIYYQLCSLYKHNPILNEYCVFTDISDNTIRHLLAGGSGATPARVTIFTNWVKICENAQISSDTVKSMFILKSCYGYSEEPKPETIAQGKQAVLPVADDYLLTDK